jgi:hypothetical protein
MWSSLGYEDVYCDGRGGADDKRAAKGDQGIPSEKAADRGRDTGESEVDGAE